MSTNTNKKNTKRVAYRTYRQKAEDSTFFAVYFFISGCVGFGIAFSDEMKESPHLLIMPIAVGILTIGWFVYSISGNAKRNKYKKKGECFPGYIIGAEMLLTGERYNRYCLLISFNDNGEKIKYTEFYMGSPNIYLKSRNCNIYKYKNKYIEADLETVEEITDTYYLGIPTTKFQGFFKDKYV